MSDVRERLKNSDLSLFGNIDEILATTASNSDVHMKAVIKLNNSIDDKVRNNTFFTPKANLSESDETIGLNISQMIRMEEILKRIL